jgi:hypothetical protein
MYKKDERSGIDGAFGNMVAKTDACIIEKHPNKSKIFASKSCRKGSMQILN